MPVYNGEKYLREAIESMLNQTYKEFDFLIINDGSTDRSVEIIESYKDPRIKLLHNDGNKGLVITRNRGFQESQTEFIALFDCDDIAHRQRLESQISFLEKNSDFGMVGSWVEIIDEDGKPTGTNWKNNLSSEKISAILLFQNYFAQPSLMIRKNALPEVLYQPQFPPAEDYDLWIRIAEKWKTWNLQKLLLKYRRHSKNISKEQKERQQNAIDEIIKSQLSKLDISPTPEELKIHRTNYTYMGNDLMNFLEKRDVWLKRLKKANNEIRYYSEPEFSEVISERWLASCSANARGGMAVWKKFWQSPLSKNINYKNWKEISKFFIKCLLQKDSLRYV